MRIALTTLFLLVTTACATRAEVEEIVTLSNAAMVGPLIERPGDAPPVATCAEAVDRMDRLIARHPDQPVLVNHLRVRQAMLLMVCDCPNLARATWERIEPDELRGNSRDRSLYDVREALMWSCRMLPGVDLLNVEEQETGDRHGSALRDQKGPEEVRDYFRIIAAQVALKVANSMGQNSDEEKDEVRDRLDRGAKRLIADMSDHAVMWADSSAAEKQDNLMMVESLVAARYGLWIEEVVGLFEEQAQSVERPLALAWMAHVRILRNGEPVPGAVVTIRSPRHAAHETRTDESGAATIVSRVPGKVRFRASAGRDTFEKTLEIGHGVTVNLELENQP